MNSRQAKSSDAEQIKELLTKFCFEYYEKVVEETKAVEGISHLFENPHLGRYYVCEENGILIGYAMVFFEWSDWRAGNMFYMETAYTLPEHRKRGVFKSLYKLMHDDAQIENSALRTILPTTFPAESLIKLGLIESHYNLLEIKF